VSSFREKYLTNIWNVPNVLTMLRMALIPVFVVLFVHELDKWALVVFLLASATDALDGYLARKNHQVTAFGKLMVCTALICQGVRGVFPWPAIVIVFLKESLMIVGGIFMLSRNVVVYSDILGKAAQFTFIAALVLSFWHFEFAAISLPLDRIFLVIAVVLAFAALISYARSALSTIKDMKQK